MTLIETTAYEVAPFTGGLPINLSPIHPFPHSSLNCTITPRSGYNAGMRWVWLLLCIFLAGFAAAVVVDDPDVLALVKALPTAKEYPGDDAVWLRRDTEITMAAGGGLTVREHKYLTLLTPMALRLAQWEIPYDKATETLQVKTVRTILHQTAYEVDPAQVVESALYPGVAWYDALVVRRFPLPAATVGATLEIDTIFNRETPRMADAFSTRLQVQQGYPVREARYTVRVPEEKRLALRFTGFTPKVVEITGGGQRIYTWTVRDLPALRIREANTPPAADLAMSVRITTLESWAPVAAWYGQVTAGADALTPDLRAVADKLTEGCATADEKIAALHKGVRELPYVAVEMGNLSDVPHSADAVLRQGYGDCKDKSTLLKALLQAAGIDSAYVLVRTTDLGALDKACYGPDEFNHVILAVPQPGGDRFLDATVAELPPTLLPPNVEGAPALIVRGQGELVTLPASMASDNHTEVDVQVTVQADGSATGEATITFTGLSAVLQRGMLARVPDERYREALEGTLAPRLGSEVAIKSVEVQALTEPTRPLVVQVRYTSPAYLQDAGPQRSGMLAAFMYQPNPYRTITERSYPFMQRLATSLHQQVRVTLPEGYTITHLPEPVAFTSPMGSYADRATTEGNTVHYTCELANVRGEFPATALPDFRKWGATLALEGRNHLQFFLSRADAR